MTLAVGVLFAAESACAQLRIATYNTLDNPTNVTDDGLLTTIMSAIGTTPVNGIAKRIDVLALQEQTISPPSTNTVSRTASLLNNLYGVSSYTSAVSGFGSDQLAFVYDASTVELVTQNSFTVGTRPGLWMQLRPLGYTSPEALFNVYSLHLKAGDTDTDKNIRESETLNIRTHAAGLGDGANLIYMGDFNIGANTDANDAFGELAGAGVNQPNDPAGLVFWPNNSAEVSRQLTQSTRTASIGDGGATGGIDDRFDLQFVTAPLMDGEGLSYIGPTVPGMTGLAHSHRAFGNDGTSYDQAITSPASGRSQPANVLQALHDYSDHLPVVADYQVPAILDAVAGNYPPTFNVGQEFNFELTVSNAANVVAAIGADELDYSISWEFGDPFIEIGNDYFAQMDLALGGGNMHLIGFDTSTPGMKSGMITVASGSQGVKNPLVEIPISFEVLAVAMGLAGDFNHDGVVDAADYSTWRDHFGDADETALNGNGDGMNGVDAGDYALWVDQFGEHDQGSGGGSVGVGTVPEPGAWALVVVGVCLLPRRAATLKA